MWTTVKLDVCYDQSQELQLKKALGEVWKRIEDISWRINVYDQRSDVRRINTAYPNPATVGSDTYQLIKDSLEYNRLTFGVFDITVWPLIKLWKDSEQRNELPTAAQLQDVKKIMGADKIELPARNQVRLLNAQTEIDLSSVTDGYAGDETVRIMRAHGFQNFLIDTSGELYAAGMNCEGKKWRIGIRDPRDGAQIIDVVELSNTSVTTSGNYEKSYEIKGERWSHIINPITGYPQKEVNSATVIGPDTEKSDALSTALCVLDPKRGTALIDSLGEGWASVVYYSDGQGRLQKKKSHRYRRFQSREKH